MAGSAIPCSQTTARNDKTCLPKSVAPHTAIPVLHGQHSSSSSSHHESILPSLTDSTIRLQYDESLSVSDDRAGPLLYEDPPVLQLNTTCPYHGSLLGLSLQHFASRQESAANILKHEFLSNIPPLGLSSHCRLGTSASCGCNCGQIPRDDLGDISQDLLQAVHSGAPSTQSRSSNSKSTDSGSVGRTP